MELSIMKSWNKLRKAATAFSKRWKNAYDEKAQAQSFLKEFFAVFGVDTVIRSKCTSCALSSFLKTFPRLVEGSGFMV